MSVEALKEARSICELEQILRLAIIGWINASTFLVATSSKA